MTTIAERLKQAAQIRHVTQADIVRMCQPYCKEFGAKMGSNDISQYVTGKIQPKSRKLAVLALALNVSEDWLKGYDAPMDRGDRCSPGTVSHLTEHEEVLIAAYRQKPEMQEAVDTLLGLKG